MHPIRINTAYGVRQFEILSTLNEETKKNDTNDIFVSECSTDFHVQSVYLEYFLDDDKMSRKYKMDSDDDEGFRIFNEQSDLCTVLKYFGKVK
jgi:hypothetical protein